MRGSEFQLAPHRVEVEIETIDSVDLGEASIADATGDSALDPTGFLGVRQFADQGE